MKSSCTCSPVPVNLTDTLRSSSASSHLDYTTHRLLERQLVPASSVCRALESSPTELTTNLPPSSDQQTMNGSSLHMPTAGNGSADTHLSAATNGSEGGAVSIRSEAQRLTTLKDGITARLDVYFDVLKTVSSSFLYYAVDEAGTSLDVLRVLADLKSPRRIMSTCLRR